MPTIIFFFASHLLLVFAHLCDPTGAPCPASFGFRAGDGRRSPISDDADQSDSIEPREVAGESQAKDPA